MAEPRLSWADWQQKANSAYIKGQYGASQMIKDWGYPAEFDSKDYKIEFDKGIVKRKDRKVRQGNRNAADELRYKRDQPSTEIAAKERKALERQIQEERQSTLVLYGTGGLKPVLEHNAQLSDPYWESTTKSPADPNNLSKSDPFFEAQKTEFETYNTRNGRPFVPTINEITGELRAIPRKFFDATVDPSKLPGVDIPFDENPREAFDKALNFLPGISAKTTGAVRFTPGAAAASPKPVAKPTPVVKPLSVAKPTPVAKPKPTTKPKVLTNKGASVKFSSRSLIPTEVPSQERYGPGGMIGTIDLPHEQQFNWQR